MNTVKVTSIFLGAMSLSFGALKFVDPFRGWYSVQIESSGLPGSAFSLGIISELITGIIFLLPFLFAVTDRKKFFLLTLANSSLIMVLTAATIVHLIPEVPATVLPLKIKPPIIPVMFLAIAVLNQMNVTKRALSLNKSNNSRHNEFKN
jgi:hypothetical protein